MSPEPQLAAVAGHCCAQQQKAGRCSVCICVETLTVCNCRLGLELGSASNMHHRTHLSVFESTATACCTPAKKLAGPSLTTAGVFMRSARNATKRRRKPIKCSARRILPAGTPHKSRNHTIDMQKHEQLALCWQGCQKMESCCYLQLFMLPNQKTMACETTPGGLTTPGMLSLTMSSGSAGLASHSSPPLSCCASTRLPTRRRYSSSSRARLAAWALRTSCDQQQQQEQQ